MPKVILSLTDKVEEQFGYPQEWFKPEADCKFVTVKEFIDNPETVERWRYLNSHNNDIKFSNEVYEYIDRRFFTEEEQSERKIARDLQK
jgi:hypothetical protein